MGKKNMSLARHVAHGVAGLANAATVLAGVAGMHTARDKVIDWRTPKLEQRVCSLACKRSVAELETMFRSNMKLAREGVLTPNLSDAQREEMTALVQRNVRGDGASPVPEGRKAGHSPRAVDISRDTWRKVQNRVNLLQKIGRLTPHHVRMAKVMSQRVALLARPDMLMAGMVPPQLRQPMGGLDEKQFLDVWAQATTVFMEAKGEGLAGMAAVNRVIDNLGGGVDAVMVFAKFSCWSEDHAPLPEWDELDDTQRQALADAFKLAALSRMGAKEVTAMGMDIRNQQREHGAAQHRISRQTLHYVNHGKLPVKPAWLVKMAEEIPPLQIGNHTFYDPARARAATEKSNGRT